MATEVSEIRAILRKLNPSRKDADICIYADALHDYAEAAEHIREHGTLLSHPRTGVPFENPYLRIRDRAGQIIGRFRSMATGDLWGGA